MCYYALMLIAHVIIAISGIIISTLLYLKPSDKKYTLSMTALVLTLLSGSSLVVTMQASLVRACLSGLAYVSFVSVLIYLGSRKLAKETSNS